jgi:hypothetical protein
MLNSGKMRPASLSYVEWFEKVLNAPLGEGTVYSPGAIFCVSSRNIRRRHVGFYKKLRSYLEGHANPEEGHYMERSWLYIFARGTDIKILDLSQISNSGVPIKSKKEQSSGGSDTLTLEQQLLLQAHYVDVIAFGKKTDSYDILHTATMLSAFESAQYYCENMSTAKNFDNNLALLGHGMSLRTINGLVLEFGVASGTTINHIASQTDQAIYGFDTFAGLPETWRTGLEAGAFAQEPPKVPPHVELIQGRFEDTLQPFLENHPGCASLIHVDCDLYSSTKTIFSLMRDRIVPGTVIVFDEYFNYPGWKQHEFQAFHEFLTETSHSYEYAGFVSSHQQVCVIIR